MPAVRTIAPPAQQSQKAEIGTEAAKLSASTETQTVKQEKTSESPKAAPMAQTSTSHSTRIFPSLSVQEDNAVTEAFDTSSAESMTDDN